jgi:O-antigen ligase
MLDKLFFLILVLNATGLFRFLAQLGVEIGQVSIALLGLHVVYLLARRRYLVPLLRRRDMKYWLFLFLLWPLVTVLYAPALEIRQIGLQLYYASLFCAAVVYAMASGLAALHRVMAVSLGLTIFGIVLSMIAPGYFEAVAQLAGARAAYYGRAFGFEIQPNAAATCLVFLFIGWYSLWRRKNSLWEVVALLMLLGTTILTGSRTGAVVAAIICGLIFIHAFRKKWLKETTSSFFRVYAKVFILTACLIIGFLWLNQYTSSKIYNRGDLYDRIAMLTSFKLEYSYFSESSNGSRFGAQLDYMSLIREKPLFGHGFGAEAHYLDQNTLYLSSHSQLLTCLMEYGILYPVAFCLLMIRMYRSRQRVAAEEAFGTNSILQFVLVTLLLFAINGGLLNGRMFYVVFALFFVSVQWPSWVDDGTGPAGHGNVLHRSYQAIGDSCRTE